MRGKKAVITNKMDDPRDMMQEGMTFWVEGSLADVFGTTLSGAMMNGNWAAKHYVHRAELNGLPMNDPNDLYYGKVDSLGHILHRTEFEYVQ